MTSQSPQLDVNFANLFVEGALETLKEQCHVDSHAGSMFLKGKAPFGYDIAIAGVVALSGPAFNGSIALCFTEKLFLTLLNNSSSGKHAQITSELEKDAQKLVDKILSRAKEALSEKGYSITKAVPTIVKGNGVDAKHATIVLPFQTAHGPYHIEICLDPSPIS
jgi:CheY-specific phosphatase CheX